MKSFQRSWQSWVMCKNDAFGSAHRAHASTTVAAKFFSADKRMFGKLMASEVESAERVLRNSQKPFTAILGGAKVSDKILIIENLLGTADNIIIGGGMAYTFFKAMGGNIGKSLVEEDRIGTAKDLLEKAKQKGADAILFRDYFIQEGASVQTITKSDSIGGSSVRVRTTTAAPIETTRLDILFLKYE